MPDAFIVGTTGLPQYRYPDWRAGLAQRFRDAYGDDADTSPETPDGLVIDTITLETSQLGDAIQSTYANSFVRSAEGTSLDRLLDVFGRQRLAAEPTTVSAVWYGDAGTVVWSGVGTGPVASVVSTGGSNGDRYEVTEAGTIPAIDDDGAVVVIVLSSVTDGNDYTIDVDGVEQATVTTAGPGDTLEDVATAWAAAIASDEPTWTVTYVGLDGDGRALILIQDKAAELIEEGVSISDSGELDIYPAIVLAMSAERSGPQQVLAGTLRSVETPAAGLSGVANPLDGELGRDRETDAELRLRHFDQINVGGRGTPARIRAALLDQDPSDRDALDLESVRVFSNPTDEEADVGGRTVPAHAFEVVLLGDATDDEIAAVLFDQTPAGIQSYGDTEVEVEDEVGGTHTVAFTRATELYLHLEITVTAGEGFPSTGDPETAIIEAVVADLETRLTLGQDFHRVAALAVAITTVPGITTGSVECDATAAPGDVPTLAGLDITVAAAEILRVDSSRITVVIS